MIITIVGGTGLVGQGIFMNLLKLRIMNYTVYQEMVNLKII